MEDDHTPGPDRLQAGLMEHLPCSRFINSFNKHSLSTRCARALNGAGRQGTQQSLQAELTFQVMRKDSEGPGLHLLPRQREGLLPIVRTALKSTLRKRRPNTSQIYPEEMIPISWPTPRALHFQPVSSESISPENEGERKYKHQDEIMTRRGGFNRKEGRGKKNTQLYLDFISREGK